MRKKLYIILFCLVIAVAASGIVLLLSTSNDRTDFVYHDVTATDVMPILDEKSPVYNLIVSDELFEYMKENSIDMLDMASDYFNVIINQKIESNVIYIRSDPHKMNAEFNLVDVYDTSNKFSAIIRIAECARQAAGFPDLKQENSQTAEQPQTAVEKSDREKALSAMYAMARKLADKGSAYTKNAVEQDLIAQTMEIYDSSTEIMASDHLVSLKYKDYYVNYDGENRVSIVCGSLETACSALEYFVYEYIQNGRTEGNYFVIPTPKTELRAGEYLDCMIGGIPVKDYSIEYVSSKTYYDSREIAEYLNQYFIKNYGKDMLARKSDYNWEQRYKIIIGAAHYDESELFYNRTDEAGNPVVPDLMDYKIVQKDRHLYILGGSDWAIKYAVDYLIENFFSPQANIPQNYTKSGNFSGEALFPLTENATVRIMSNNVWDRPWNSYAWQEIGENCSNMRRFQKIAKVYAAYLPDVLSLQEMSYYFINQMVEDINQYGGGKYRVADYRVAGLAQRNYTPIIYNQKTVTLLDSGSHVFHYASNASTKSYTWAYFRHNKTGRCFLVYSTHLWWRNNKIEPKSSYYRTRQLTEICDDSDVQLKKYDCPCFVMGDMNCKATSDEFKTLLKRSFSDCFGFNYS